MNRNIEETSSKSESSAASKPKLLVRLVKRLRAHFFAGILLLVPLWLTYFALRFFFLRLDNIFAPLIRRTFGISIPGLGFLLLFVFIFLVGLITRNIVGRSLVHFGESILERIPFVKNVYQATKQLTHIISFSRTLGFQRVVFVEYPRPGFRALGFVTNTVRDSKENKKYTSVFIPTTPNPTSGVFELVPEKEVMETQISIEDGIKMVISGGLIMPDHLTGREASSGSR